jgi:hypothetical protein
MRYGLEDLSADRLLIEGTTLIERVANEPAPRVLEQSFGNYSVEF